MSSIKTLAVIYEMGKEREYKNALDKLLFGNYCFTFVCVDPKMENTFSFPGGEVSKQLKEKLDAAEELYVVNPKGNIAHYLYHFLAYAKETGKPVQYMYKFCYKDCKYRGKGGCTQNTELYCIPDFHKLLPACESYARIYDDLLVGSRQTYGEPEKAPVQEAEKETAKGQEKPSDKKTDKVPVTVGAAADEDDED